MTWDLGGSQTILPPSFGREPVPNLLAEESTGKIVAIAAMSSERNVCFVRMKRTVVQWFDGSIFRRRLPHEIWS